MSREVWTRDDLRNALGAVYYAGVVAAPDCSADEAELYLEGFRAALVALALNFGLSGLPLPGAEVAPDLTRTSPRQLRVWLEER